MSGTDLASSDASEYFRRVEDIFIRLRGAPLFLSPADYRTAKEWYLAEVPLAVVEEALREVFEKQEKSGKPRRGLTHLKYCRPAVERAFAEYRERAATGRREEPAPGPDIAGRLAALASSLPPDLPGRGGWMDRVTRLSGSMEAVEKALADLDEELMKALAADLDADAEREVETQVDQALTNLAERLSEAELVRSRDRLYRRFLRRSRRAPVLSLYSPEAAVPPSPPGAG